MRSPDKRLGRGLPRSSPLLNVGSAEPSRSLSFAPPSSKRRSRGRLPRGFGVKRDREPSGFAIRFRRGAGQSSAQPGTQNSASETHFRVRRPRPVVPAEQSLQTISFQATALNSRGIVGVGDPERLVRTSWWRTQSCKTRLRGLALPGNREKNREIHRKSRVWHPMRSENACNYKDSLECCVSN
jgi:hypothetical protein